MPNPCLRRPCEKCGKITRTRKRKALCKWCAGFSRSATAQSGNLAQPLKEPYVRWYAMRAARRQPLFTDPVGRWDWGVLWRLAFPHSGSAESGTARQRIREALGSAGRADLIPVALRPA